MKLDAKEHWNQIDRSERMGGTPYKVKTVSKPGEPLVFDTVYLGEPGYEDAKIVANPEKPEQIPIF